MWTEEDLIYAAGFLDGEGCFHVSPPRRSRAAISCTNTYKPVIEWFQKIFGGYIQSTKLPSNSGKHGIPPEIIHERIRLTNKLKQLKKRTWK